MDLVISLELLNCASGGITKRYYVNFFSKTSIVETLREIGEYLRDFWACLLFETNVGESDRLLIDFSY